MDVEIPTIGRTVIYRAPLGLDVPAIVTATRDTIAEAIKAGTTDREVRPLSSPAHLHLTLLTPSTTSELGTAKARDIPPCYPGEEIEPATWRWPERPVATKSATQHMIPGERAPR